MNGRIAKSAIFAILFLIVAAFLPMSSPAARAASIPVFDLELNDGYDAPFALENIKPGDMGSKVVMLRNIGNVDGQIAIWVSNIQEGDYANDGAHLDDYLVFEVNCADLSSDIRMPCSIWSLPEAPLGNEYVWVLNVRAGQTISITWFWEFLENYQSQNTAKGDSLSFDINYLLGQMPPPNDNLSWVEVNVLGRATLGLLSSDARTMEQVVATDESRTISLTLPAGMSCLSEDNRTIRFLMVSEEQGMLQVGSGQSLVSPIYHLAALLATGTEAHGLKEGQAALRIDYDPALLPTITDAVSICMRVTNGSWTPLVVPADSASPIGQSCGLINRSGEFAVIASYDPNKSAVFLPSSLTIEPSKRNWWNPIIFVSRVGDEIQITVVVTNVGQVSGEDNITLTMNGQYAENQKVVLGPMESKEVTFEVKGLSEGEYNVEVSGLSGDVIVATQVNWWLIIIVSSLPAALVIGYAYSIRRWEELRRRVDALQGNVLNMESKLADSEKALAAINENQKPRAVPVSYLNTNARKEPSPVTSVNVNETLAEFVASTEPKNPGSSNQVWIGDNFHRLESTPGQRNPLKPEASSEGDSSYQKSNVTPIDDSDPIIGGSRIDDANKTNRISVATGSIPASGPPDLQIPAQNMPKDRDGLIAMPDLLASLVVDAERGGFESEGQQEVADQATVVDQAKTIEEATDVRNSISPSERIDSNGKALEEAFAIEESIKLEEEVESHQLNVAKQFILSRIQSRGQLVIDEVPIGHNGLVAMTALSQLVEEGKIRVIQQKRHTIYVIGHPE
ncbi:MAG TPA: hypothetical protein VLU38_03895 [Methanomassiliicoccales archaeon]|nr:hypothetical protein [Methanomassiliicoccales archaeon]